MCSLSASLILSISDQSPVTSPFPFPTVSPRPLCSVSYPVQVHKLLIVVELLLGEIPDRLQFRQPSLKRSLMPYFLLTQGKAGLLELWPVA